MSPDLLTALEDLADGERLLVALDFDGTISPIVAVPSEARPAPGALELLRGLSASPATEVVLVSGRSRRDLATVSGAAGVATLVGSHGQEIGADLTPDATYYYWLEDVDLNGAATRHGPVSAVFQGPTAVELSNLHAGSESKVDPTRWWAALAAAFGRIGAAGLR